MVTQLMWLMVIVKIEKSALINVAVTLAKKYLDEKDYKFINAVLDKVL